MAMNPRSMAADKLLAGLGGDPMGGGGGDLPPMMEEEAALPQEDAGAGGIDAALAGVEAAIADLPEESAREIRTHMEAIRDIASREPQAEKDMMGAEEGLEQAAADVPPPATPPDEEMPV